MAQALKEKSGEERSRIGLLSPVTVVPGIGGQRAECLARLGIETVHDLLLHGPRKYEDRRNFQRIGEIAELGPVCTRGTVVEVGLRKYARGFKSQLLVVLDDGTGRLHCRWWNQPWLEKNFSKGQELLVFGRVKELKPRTMDHPDVEVDETGEAGEEGEEDSIHLRGFVPVYPLTEGITQRMLRGWIHRALFDLDLEWVEPLPKELVPHYPSHEQAVRDLHFPEELARAKIARERLALEEFVALQFQIQLRRRNLEAKAPRLSCPGDNSLIRRFLPKLGYELTDAQKRVLREIRHDLAEGIPMRRLLQGDVGSGKTVVAGCAALMVIESGRSAVLMAPTEILAEQHFRNFSRWFEPLKVGVKLWTGSVKSELDGNQLMLDGNDGRGQLVIGTHALIQSSFSLANLGLVIIDEQHKFGVAQREELVRKGSYPHLLVMTATPIPRTLGLTLYGDLDNSVLDELPPGRKPIRTYVRSVEKLPQVWEFVKSRLEKGEQAYIVYARVESDTNAKAVLKEVENIGRAVHPWRVAALHGKLKPAEKELIMESFRGNRTQVLVASALIEVGVDVPNATVMVIENAEQFGIAQLHQLRGRIGRGGKTSHCVLISTAKTDEARERLEVLEKTQDGFELAEADLRFRGPGELLGQEQSGLPQFRFADLVKDLKLLRHAKDIAAELVARTPAEQTGRTKPQPPGPPRNKKGGGGKG